MYLFSEYDHVAYQVKADDACSNMAANILPIDTMESKCLEVHAVGSKVQISLRIITALINQNVLDAMLP